MKIVVRTPPSRSGLVHDFSAKPKKLGNRSFHDFQAFEVFISTHENSFEFSSFAYQGANAVEKLFGIFSLTEKPRASEACERTLNPKIAPR